MAKNVVKSLGTAKEQHRLKLLEYLANPDNEILNRSTYATEVLGISASVMYRTFDTEELSIIEDEALKKRRARIALKLGQVDKALFDKAIIDKDVKAIELIYKRLEGWNPNHKIELSENANPESIEISFSVIDGKKAD